MIIIVNLIRFNNILRRSNFDLFTGIFEVACILQTSHLRSFWCNLAFLFAQMVSARRPTVQSTHHSSLQATPNSKIEISLHHV